jgi:putative transcriptional regulator
MLVIQTAWLLASRDESHDNGLWFVFHSEEDGLLAVDISTPHPDLSYAPFASVLDGEDRKAESEKTVLLGGPLQSEDALVILHSTIAESPDSHVLNDEFSFKSYRYRLIHGKPPAITTQDNAPTRISLSKPSDFLVIVGFRLWTAEALKEEMQKGIWKAVPATPEIVFQTPREDKPARALALVN